MANWASNDEPAPRSFVLNSVTVSGRSALRHIGQGRGRTFQIPRPPANLSQVYNVMLAEQTHAGEGLLANSLQLFSFAEKERAVEANAMDLLDLVSLSRPEHGSARVLSGGQRKLLGHRGRGGACPGVIQFYLGGAVQLRDAA